MKLVPPLFVVVLLCATNLTLAQNKETCNSNTEPIIEDLSNITKCSIEEVKDKNSKTKSELKISYRKVRRRNIKKETSNLATKKESKDIAHTITSSQKDVSNTSGSIQVNSLNLKKAIASEVVLFSVVDEVPRFSKCVSDKIKNKRKCFNNQISKHFAKNFYPERAGEDDVKGKVFIQFTVDFQGKISDVLVKSRKNSPTLTKEIKRVISKLPKLFPGTHKGLPVNVKYSLPINISLN